MGHLFSDITTPFMAGMTSVVTDVVDMVWVLPRDWQGLMFWTRRTRVATVGWRGLRRTQVIEREKEKEFKRLKIIRIPGPSKGFQLNPCRPLHFLANRISLVPGWSHKMLEWMNLTGDSTIVQLYSTVFTLFRKQTQFTIYYSDISHPRSLY